MMISIKNLSKTYGSQQALKGISLDIPVGIRFGLVGADGGGKSTCLRLLAGLEKKDSGSIEIQGVASELFIKKFRQKIGWMPQKFALYTDLSVWENLNFYGQLYGMRSKYRQTRAQLLLDFVRMADFKDRRAKDLSGGMKQKLALACALLHEPEILFLDEPTVGVDPVSRQEFRVLLDRLRDQELTVVMSTPYMDEGEACDRVALFHQGQIITQGIPNKLLQSPPCYLWEICFDGSVHWSMSQVCPLGVELIYPQAGHLRLMTFWEKEQIIPKIKQLFPSAVSIVSVDWSLEDLVLWYLRCHDEGY